MYFVLFFSDGKVRGQKRDASRSCQSPAADRAVTGEDRTPDMFRACHNKAMTTDVDSLMHIKNTHRQVRTVVQHKRKHTHIEVHTHRHTRTPGTTNSKNVERKCP